MSFRPVVVFNIRSAGLSFSILVSFCSINNVDPRLFLSLRSCRFVLFCFLLLRNVLPAPQGPPEEGEVLYEENVHYFDDSRKWKERYVVVRANYCLECHDSLEVNVKPDDGNCQNEKLSQMKTPLPLHLQTFVKGVPPRDKLLPTGGTVLTTEEAYMALVDRCFPDDSSKFIQTLKTMFRFSTRNTDCLLWGDRSTVDNWTSTRAHTCTGVCTCWSEQTGISQI